MKFQILAFILLTFGFSFTFAQTEDLNAKFQKAQEDFVARSNPQKLDEALTLSSAIDRSLFKNEHPELHALRCKDLILYSQTLIAKGMSTEDVGGAAITYDNIGSRIAEEPLLGAEHSCNSAELAYSIALADFLKKYTLAAPSFPDQSSDYSQRTINLKTFATLAFALLALNEPKPKKEACDLLNQLLLNTSTEEKIKQFNPDRQLETSSTSPIPQ